MEREPKLSPEEENFILRDQLAVATEMYLAELAYRKALEKRLHEMTSGRAKRPAPAGLKIQH